MIDIVGYNPDYKIQWDNTIRNSRNGTFLFYRDYMDYHSDRFIDNSFLVIKKGKVGCLIPGNIDKNTFVSHQGLTYGGLITTQKIKVNEVIEIFNQLDNALKAKGIQEVIYKPVPLIYHRIPSQEDIYALFKKGAEKIGCKISSIIHM